MIFRCLIVAFLASGFPQTVFADDAATATGQSSPGASQSQSSEALPQELRQKLTKAGYTNVKIVPSAFLVSAKNKSGQDVLMSISPNSMTVLAQEPSDDTPNTGGVSNAPSNGNAPGSK